MLFDVLPQGFQHHQNYLPIERQNILLASVRDVIRQNPLYRPINKQAKFEVPFALENTNCGSWAWFPYFYQQTNLDGSKIPPIPNEILEVVYEFVDENYIAENCLINSYKDMDGKKSHLGIHQDKSEWILTKPIVSISLGLDCLFGIGGVNRNDYVQEIRVKSGDVIVMGGESRNAFHKVNCILPNTLPKGLEMKTDERINLTIRQVKPN